MAIFTKDLSKKYGNQVALDKVSIDLKKEKLLVFLDQMAQAKVL